MKTETQYAHQSSMSVWGLAGIGFVLLCNLALTGCADDEEKQESAAKGATLSQEQLRERLKGSYYASEEGCDESAKVISENLKDNMSFQFDGDRLTEKVEMAGYLIVLPSKIENLTDKSFNLVAENPSLEKLNADPSTAPTTEPTTQEVPNLENFGLRSKDPYTYAIEGSVLRVTQGESCFALVKTEAKPQ